MMIFTEKEGVVLVSTQMIFHDGGYLVNHLMNLRFGHAGNEYIEEAIIAEVLQKGDQGLFVGGAINAKIHAGSFGGIGLAGDDFPPD
jgi:hypothetical protein